MPFLAQRVAEQGHAVVVVAEVRTLLLTPCPIRLNIPPVVPSHLPQTATHAAHPAMSSHLLVFQRLLRTRPLCSLHTTLQGAGEELLGESAETDASGNKKLPAIGEFMKNKIVEYFKRGGMEVRGLLPVGPCLAPSWPLLHTLTDPYESSHDTMPPPPFLPSPSGDGEVRRPLLHDPLRASQRVGRPVLHAAGAERRARGHGR